MSLNIKNDETCRLARELAQLTGESMTGAITVALRERLERERRQQDRDALLKDMRAIAKRCAARLGPGPSAVEHGDLPLRRARPAEVIIDSSAILAILFAEPDANRFEDTIACRVAPPHVGGRIGRGGDGLGGQRGSRGGARSRRVSEENEIELVPVTAEQANAARQAWRRFGKGNHPAALNFGDCFAYALAAVTGEPLLFKGEDFALTDIEAA